MYQNLADSRCSRTCADSSLTSPTATYADSEPVQILQNLCRFQSNNHLPDSSVTSPRTTCANSSVRTTCADSRCSRTCADSSVPCLRATCADSSVTPMSPVQIPLVQIQMFRASHKSTATYADSPRTYEHSTCIRTCADSDVPEPVQIPVSQVPQPPMQILHLSEPVQILQNLNSSVTSPTATYADSTCIRTCADSSVTSPTATYADSTCIRTCADSSVTSPTATYADST
ncbi:hypothetical protein TNCV_1280271 [Trichonephila clavipes]|nr:hypothetical protein TNCV_1280271 [Trichonephila clavipes]